MKKVLVTYYSRKGENYYNGNIKNLEIGNTEVVAKTIHNFVGGDLFEVKTIKTYPKDYYETTDVSKQELTTNARPEIQNPINSIDDYDVIFLGYPNWWSTMPMVMFTFLELFDFSGKTIIPFCTHEGSGMGKSESDIKKLCKSSNVLKGLPIKGSSVRQSENLIKDWISKLNIY